MPGAEELRHLPLGRKLIQWPIATPVHLPAPLVAGDTGGGILGDPWDRDRYEGHADRPRVAGRAV
jgi:hypothetical protein